MDIVAINKEARRSKSSLRRAERRHTTEVRFDQLPSHTLSELERDTLTSLSSEDLSPRGEDYRHPVADFPQVRGADSSHLLNGQFYQPSFKNSWGNIAGHSYNFRGSQGDVYQELTEHAQYPEGIAGHQYKLSYDLAMDNVLTPFCPPQPITSPLASPPSKLSRSMQKSHLSHVVEEMVTTETTYVSDLSGVIEGYLMPLQMRTSILPYNNRQLSDLFGNITVIRDFHSSFLKQFNKGSAISISELGQCFIDRADVFKQIYTQYCNNYPNSIRVLVDLSKQSEIARFLKTCQLRLKHPLPLGAYLLKPVQRILKYSLLLSEIVKTTHEKATGFTLIQTAMLKMTEVAEHINAMKRKYDTAVHVQELQSLLRGNENLDLTKFGDLVLEDHFKYSSGKSSASTFRGRTERYVFLFQHLYLVTKKEEVGYQYKMHVEMKDLQLTERIEKEPTCFQIRQVSSGRASTFQARSSQQRSEWVQKIKLLLIESIPHLPERARELIMRGFDVPRDPSPSRELRRHATEEPGSPASPQEGVVKGSGQESLLDAQRSNSLGRNFSPQTMAQHADPSHTGPSHTGPSHTGPTKQSRGRYVSGKLQASLTGLLVSSIHQPPSSPRSGSPVVGGEDHTHGFLGSPEQRDSGYSDTAGDPHRLQPKAEGMGPRSEWEELPHTPDRGKTRKLFPLDPLRATPELDHTPNLLNSPVDTPPLRCSPVALHHGSDHMTVHVENGTDRVTSHMTEHDGTDQVLPSVAEGVRHTQYDASPQDPEAPPNQMVIEEAETLFDELMDNKPREMKKEPSSSDMDWGNRSLHNTLTQEDIQQIQDAHHLADISSDAEPQHSLRGGSIDEENTTPRPSPYTSPSTIRRWSVTKRRSYDTSDPEDSTPKASPYIHRHQSASAQEASSSQTSVEDWTFDEPILDPPTPFRIPFPANVLQPCPDEGLEFGQDLEDSSGRDQGVSLFHSDSSGRDQGVSLFHSVQLPPPFKSPPDDEETKRTSAKAKTLPPNMSLDDVRASMSVGRLKSESASSIRRSKSFGNKAKFHHKRDGSLSSDNSPLPSPIFPPKKWKNSKDMSPNGSVKYSSTSRGSPAPLVSVVGLISTTRTTPELQDIPLIQVDPQLGAVGGTDERAGGILPPFDGSLEEICDSRASSVSREGCGNDETEKEDKSFLAFLRLKPKKMSRSSTPSDLAIEKHRYDPDEDISPRHSCSSTTPTVATPTVATPTVATPTTAPPSISMVESRPDEMISFEDALDTYDRYASDTGKTALSAKRREKESFTSSPDTRKKKSGKKKGKKRHGYTVANIDAETMKEVKSRMSEEEKQRNSSDSKVHQLAREYSQRIKERNRNIAGYSTVLEEEPNPAMYHPIKPVWLTDLQQRNYPPTGRHSSLEDILNRVVEDDTSSVCSGVSNGDDMPGADGDRPSKAMRKSKTMDGSRNHGLLFGGVEFQEKAGEEEGQKKRRFSGWVKSLAAKFGRKEGTTL